MQRDHYDEIVAQVLIATRKELGLSQADVAEALGTTQARVVAWEGVKTRLPTADLMRLALAVFGQHPSELMLRMERVLLEEGDSSRYYR